MELQDLVVAVDFSEPSRAAVARAAVLAQVVGSRLHLVHAVRPTLVHGTALPESSGEAVAELAIRAMHRLQESLADQGVVTSFRVERSAEPVEAIAREVGAQRAALVVMGSHGDGRWTRFGLGSVAAGSVRALPCPVLVVKEKERAAAEPIRRILVATDASRHAAAASELAVAWARVLNAELALFDAWDVPATESPYSIPVPQPVERTFRERALRVVEQARASILEAEPEMVVRMNVQRGLAPERISQEAQRVRADLIVMGSRGHTTLDYVSLGSVAERTLRMAHCSVLVARPGERS